MQMTDPYLNLYRGLVPPLLGTIDFTPLLGFFILQYISGVLESGAAEDEIDECVIFNFFLNSNAWAQPLDAD
jgi:hypothetical protein